MADEVKAGLSPQRRKRIKRLKKLIIIFLLLMILIPWGVCAFLGLKLYRNENDLTKANADRVKTEEELTSKNEKVAVLKEMVTLLSEDLDEYKDHIESLNLKEEKAPVPIITESENGIRDYESPDGIKRIYLTFDDGPTPNTAKILDILEEYRDKATFFTIGNTSDEGQELYRRMIAGGHSLGIHSYTHKYGQIYASEEAYFEDFKRLSDYIYDVTGYRSRITRLPGGSSNTVSKVDMRSLIGQLHKDGIKVYDWNISGRDADGSDPEPDEIAANVLAGIEKFDTAVVLLHDGYDKANTVEALPLILDELKDREDVLILPITEDTPEILHIDTYQ